MNEQLKVIVDDPKVEVVRADLIEDTPDSIEVDLDLRISKLEGEEAEVEKTIRTISVSVLGIQNASLKHTVALSLFLAVLLFIASRALGA